MFIQVLTKQAGLRGRYSQELYRQYLVKNLANVNREDVASFAQDITEETIVRLIDNIMNHRDGAQNLCLSGGLFGNVRLNQKVRERNNTTNVFVLPNMGDGGLSLGGAIAVWETISGQAAPNTHIEDIYWGPDYTDDEIEEVLRKSGLKYKKCDQIEVKIADRLHAGDVVARFNGRMEWGPRALENRSILVRATDRRINDDLNRRLQRTEFMPFAPVILEEHAKTYFKGYKKEHLSSHFMTMTYDVNEEFAKQIEATVHIDGTARPTMCLSFR